MTKRKMDLPQMVSSENSKVKVLLKYVSKVSATSLFPDNSKREATVRETVNECDTVVREQS